MANVIDDFKANCSNFLYIFISDNAAKEVFGKSPIILQKRKNQMAYVSQAAQLTKYSYADIKNAIAEAIKELYGKTPAEVLLDVCEGKNVYSKRNVSNFPAVSGCRVGAVSAETGLPLDLQAGWQKAYSTVYNTETNEPIGVFDIDNGTQVSYFNTATKSFVAGVTPADNKESRNMWANNINWNNIIMAIINLIGSLFGVKRAKNLSSYQSDGFAGLPLNTTQSGTASVLPIMLLCVAGYMLVTKKETKSQNNE